MATQEEHGPGMVAHGGHRGGDMTETGHRRHTWHRLDQQGRGMAAEDKGHSKQCSGGGRTLQGTRVTYQVTGLGRTRDRLAAQSHGASRVPWTLALGQTSCSLSQECHLSPCSTVPWSFPCPLVAPDLGLWHWDRPRAPKVRNVTCPLARPHSAKVTWMKSIPNQQFLDYSSCFL